MSSQIASSPLPVGASVKILVAGASGDLGTQVTALLRQAGHEVWGMSRSSRGAHRLENRGIHGVLADLLNERSTHKAVERVRPDAVVSVPIALPERGPIRPGDLRTTNRLRIEGTLNLLEAAISSGVQRFLSESLVAIYGYGDRSGQLLLESSPTQRVAPPSVQPAMDALHEQERLVLKATSSGRIEGIVLRVGFYYGAEVASTRFMARLLRRRGMAVSRARGAMPWIEISDAARGVVAALERGTPGEVYNIVGEESVGLRDMARAVADQIGAAAPWELPAGLLRLTVPYIALVSETRLYVSNEKAKRELGWRPQFPTVAEGVAHAAPKLKTS